MSASPQVKFVTLTLGTTIVFQGRVREDRMGGQLESAFLELVEALVTVYRADREPPIRLTIVPL